MSYRDEIGQAHERIARLEGELREERAKNAAPSASAGPRRRGMAVAAVAVAAALLGGAVAFFGVRTDGEPKSILQVPVDEVVRDQARYRNRLLRVQGTLVVGSFTKKGEPCELSMVMERNGVLLKVHQRTCVLPDLFRADSEIPMTAEGQLGGDGIFESRQIIVRSTF